MTAGGARPGAGRKKSPTRMVQVTVRLRQVDAALVQTLTGEPALAAAVRAAITAFVTGKRPLPHVTHSVLTGPVRVVRDGVVLFEKTAASAAPVLLAIGETAGLAGIRSRGSPLCDHAEWAQGYASTSPEGQCWVCTSCGLMRNK